MSREHSDKNKNQLHPNALSLEDLTVGLEFVVFHLWIGVIHENKVLSEPFIGYPCTQDPNIPVYEGQSKAYVIATDSGFGWQDHTSLEYMGVLPDENGHWAEHTFSVRAEDRHLLPAPECSSPAEYDDRRLSDVLGDPPETEDTRPRLNCEHCKIMGPSRDYPAS